MTIQYKLTDSNGKTQNDTEWGPGKKYTTTGIPQELCTDGWLHCYSDPVLAVMMNPIHANFLSPRIAIVECSGEHLTDHGLKEGWTVMEFVEWTTLTEVTREQRIAFAILCAKQVYKDKEWNAWADRWLNNTDRSIAAAAYAAYAAANASTAAYAAAYAAYAAAAANAASTAAANAAARRNRDLDLISLAHKALEYK